MAFEKKLDKFRVLCLCKRPDGILMWSHYASNHEGVCLEFRVLKDSVFANAVPVEYAEEYPKFKLPGEMNELAVGMVGTKAKLWEYEDEWRVGSLEARGLNDFPSECLSAVIFGLQISDKNKALISKWLMKRTSPVTLYRAVKEEHKFAVRIEKVKDIIPPPTRSSFLRFVLDILRLPRHTV